MAPGHRGTLSASGTGTAKLRVRFMSLSGDSDSPAGRVGFHTVTGSLSVVTVWRGGAVARTTLRL